MSHFVNIAKDAVIENVTISQKKFTDMLQTTKRDGFGRVVTVYNFPALQQVMNRLKELSMPAKKGVKHG